MTINSIQIDSGAPSSFPGGRPGEGCPENRTGHLGSLSRCFHVLSLSVLLFLFVPQGARAQFATFDASNLAQAILSFLQDGDNIANNTAQFLENLGVAKEQLEFLQEMNERYKVVRDDLRRVQDVALLANNYAHMARMFASYVERLGELDPSSLTYYQRRALINEGFQYLLYASREVKRAREYLSSDTRVSEEERLRSLSECRLRVSRALSAMYSHISGTYASIDMAHRISEYEKSLDEAFRIKY